MKPISIFAGVLGLFMALGCQKNEQAKESEISKIEINNPIIRLDSIMFGLNTEKDFLDFLQKNKHITGLYFETNVAGFPELAKKLNDFYKNPMLKDFYKNSINAPNGIDTDSLQTALNQSFRYFKYYYPNAKLPKVYTAFTGFAGKDLYVSDSTIVIGLDFFIGKKAKYRPQVYDYQLHKYEKDYILPSIFNLLAANYANIDPADKSMLADMIFYGKCYQFTKTMIPNTSDSLIIGYTGIQLDETEASQEMVWGHYIDQKLLYENNPFTKAKYLDERPQTQEISPDCPGMIGRWLGWKIVKKYLENNTKETFQEFMQKPNAQQIFELSKYKGKPDIE